VGGSPTVLPGVAAPRRHAATEPGNLVTASHGRRDYLLRRLLAAGDLVAIALAGVVALILGPKEELGPNLAWGALMLPVWLVLFKLYALYDRDVKRISHSTVDDLPWLLHAVLVGSLLTWAYYKWAPAPKLVLEEIVAFGLACMCLVPLVRAVIKRLTLQAIGPERVLIVGDREAASLVRKMRAHPEYGLEPVGVMAPSERSPDVPDLPVVGGAPQEVSRLLRTYHIDRLVLSHIELDEHEMLELMRECRGLSVKVSILPQLFDVMGPSVAIDDVEGMTVLGINPMVLPRSSRFLKRALDLSVSLGALTLLGPPMLLVAGAIKLDSRGPMFFRQERIGKRGQRFQVLKFRTMGRDAEELRGALAHQSSDPNWLKLDHDPRVTRVGRLLRLTSLDELPQLWNVVKGEMSIVGPRPLIESEDRQVQGWARGRLDLTPGITGLWQVLGRTEIAFAEMIKLDYLYVTNWSLWGDIRLLLRTLPVVLSRRGAN